MCVHILVGNKRNLMLAISLIKMRMLKSASSCGIGRLIARVRRDFQVLVGEDMVDRRLGHVLEVTVKGVGFALRLGVRRKLPLHLLDGGVAWFPYNQRNALVGESILNVGKGWGGQDRHV